VKLDESVNPMLKTFPLFGQTKSKAIRKRLSHTSLYSQAPLPIFHSTSQAIPALINQQVSGRVGHSGWAQRLIRLYYCSGEIFSQHTG